MAINIENYIISKIKEIDNTLETTPGSVFYDFFIKPLSKILEEYNYNQEYILNIMTLTNVNELPEKLLDHIGLFYLETRNSGSKAYGKIYLYFNEPQYVNIIKGTLFQSGNLLFECATPYTITKVDMELNNYENNLYFAGPIHVIATDEGYEGNLNANSSFSIKSLSSYTPVKIINKDPFINGSSKETNEQFFERLKLKTHGKSLSSPYVITNTIKTLFPSVSDIEIIGANSPFMLRDLILNSVDYNNIKILNYNLCKSGAHSSPYDVKHIAYGDNFVDTSTNLGVALPPINSWVTEFDDLHYQGIYRKNDALYAEQTFGYIIDQNFSNNTIDLLSNLVTSGMWNFHDGTNIIDNTLININDVGIETNYVRLGKSVNINSSNEFAYLPLKEINNYLELINNNLATGKDITNYSNILQQVYSWIYTKKFTSINNRSPIMHKAISQHTGINIYTEMSTTDNTEEGKICYITILRNDQIFLPHDGFGLAWRKQPEYLLRINKNDYADENQKNQDLARLMEEYDLTIEEATNCLGHLSNPNFIVKNNQTAKSLIWKANIYLVDNDVLQTEAWIGYDQIWDQASGKNQFLQAGKCWIEPNQNYIFDIDIGQNLSVQAWIYKSGEERSNNNKVLNKGVTYPTYVPVAGYKYIDTETNKYALDATRGHFGIGVSETSNCEWRIYKIIIKSIVDIFPSHLFKFNISEGDIILDPNLPFTINYYGIAFDPTQPNLEGSSNLKLAIYVPNTQTWETIGFVTTLYNNGITDLNQIKISKTFSNAQNYLVDNKYLYIAAIANNDNESISYRTLRTYYIELTNQEYTGTHRGNCVDIYCHDPNNIATATATATVANNEIRLYNIDYINPFIQEIVEIREAISKLPYDRNEYIIFNDNIGLSYSETPKYRICFNDIDINGTLVEIVYRYWTIGLLVDNVFNNSEDRFPCSDQMVKIMPPTIISINDLQYSGNIDEDKLKDIIVNYINNLTNKFDKLDLINILYSNGVTYVNSDIDITIREYSHTADLNIIELGDQQIYRIPNSHISRFYTNKNEINLTRL